MSVETCEWCRKDVTNDWSAHLCDGCFGGAVNTARPEGPDAYLVTNGAYGTAYCGESLTEAQEACDAANARGEAPYRYNVVPLYARPS